MYSTNKCPKDFDTHVQANNDGKSSSAKKPKKDGTAGSLNSRLVDDGQGVPMNPHGDGSTTKQKAEKAVGATSLPKQNPLSKK
ncbi:hypothetical protein [Acanthopleuribacter pedis]|uniref:Uncharacterized protein n=1 Tax=Acanthopleuribacter pedis TaxID=442870 RepID=A0A8J7QLE6_9BACT|nr:hypothetical protein [Acanthopleuribacter pedis]MBO1323261.1 hypothetical protein [Acanthopleuribacter pedis]